MPVADPREPLRASFDALPEPTMVVGPSAQIELANRRAEDLFGYSAEELVGMAFEQLIALQNRGQVAATLGRCKGLLEVRGLRKDGTEVPLQITVGAVDQQAGRPCRRVVVLRPGLVMTQALERLLSSAPDAIIVVRSDGCIVLTNDRVEALFGYHPEELLGRPVEVLVPTRVAERHAVLRDDYFREPDVRMAHSRTGDLYGRRRDGTEFPVDIMLSPVNTEGGLLAIASVRDATERKSLEEARLALARAEEAVRLRDDFVALVAHELRTPLTPVRLHLDNVVRATMREGGVVDPQLARQLDQAFRRVEATVEKLVRTAHLLAGEPTFTREKVDLAELVREEVTAVGRQAEGARSAITLTARKDLVGVWDRAGIRQVVGELLSNAIKFGAGAPIDVSVDGEGQWAILTVRDRGIGVASEDRARLFERFARFVSSRHYAGLGIGLWLAKQIAETHGGRIVVQGEGEGATFQVRLPLTRRDDAP